MEMVYVHGDLALWDVDGGRSFEIKDRAGRAMVMRRGHDLEIRGLKYDLYCEEDGRLRDEAAYAHVIAWAMVRYGGGGVAKPNMPWIMPWFRRGLALLALAASRKARAYARIALGFRVAARRYRAAHVIAGAYAEARWNPYTQVGRNRLLHEYAELTKV